jgi:DNA-binding MarR family transcriptional regulator
MARKGAESSAGGFLLGKAARLSEKAFARVLRGAGLDSFEPGQGRIIFVLSDKGPLGQKELASIVGLDKSSLALTLDRMEEKGLVARRRDEADARRSIVSLRGGMALDPGAYEEVSAEMTALFYKGFSRKERADFEAMLERVISNLEDQG